jgi:hypothetical protein
MSLATIKNTNISTINPITPTALYGRKSKGNIK